MGAKGDVVKKQPINFPVWMSKAIQEIADKNGMTFTTVVVDLLRQELAVMGYNSGIGREAVVDSK